MFTDLPLDQLQVYQPPRTEPADFDAFWAQTLAEARHFPLKARFAPLDCGLHTLDAFDVTYAGFGGQPINAWLVLPRQRSGPLPAVVEYVGYGGGRGHALHHTLWASQGYAHFVMDTRGQGSEWRTGDTPDLVPDGLPPQIPGVMTRGIEDPYQYYYRRVFTDAVRAVEAVRSHPAIDASRVAVLGGSQGGGIALAVAGLVTDVAACLPDVPFLCHYRVATQITDTLPYFEITRYLHTHRHKIGVVFDTLNYFDGVNFAARAKAPALFSVALLDAICPPRTVFAAYNHYAGPKDIRIYDYNGHEGGEIFQHVERHRMLQRLWGQG